MKFPDVVLPAKLGIVNTTGVVCPTVVEPVKVQPASGVADTNVVPAGIGRLNDEPELTPLLFLTVNKYVMFDPALTVVPSAAGVPIVTVYVIACETTDACRIAEALPEFGVVEEITGINTIELTPAGWFELILTSSTKVPVALGAKLAIV